MHQGVLHVLFDFGYHVDVIDKEPVKKVLGNVASIGNEFAKKILGECSVFQRFSVITIARCDLIVDDFTPVVDNNMQFEFVYIYQMDASFLLSLITICSLNP